MLTPVERPVLTGVSTCFSGSCGVGGWGESHKERGRERDRERVIRKERGRARERENEL